MTTKQKIAAGVGALVVLPPLLSFYATLVHAYVASVVVDILRALMGQ